MDVGPDLSAGGRRSALAVVSAVVPGAKRADGERSQDAVAAALSEDTALIALADGAGSAKRGGYGAELAVAAAVESLQEALAENADASLEAILVEAIRDVRRTLFTVARASAETGDALAPEDLATTLSVAVVGPRRVAVASVGDGVHVVRDFRGYLELTAMAADTEVANHTDFVTGPSLDERIELTVLPAAQVESLLLSSDGLDSHLVGRRDGERWPLATIVNSLLNAPVLDGWGNGHFERLLSSDVIRRHSDDDCSLALVRRLPKPQEDSTEVAGLLLSPQGELPTGRPAWSVAGCSSLIAVELDHAIPAGADIAPRSEQVWDRAQRHPPVNWPVRRVGDNLALIPCPPAGARSIRPALSRARKRRRRTAAVAAVRECVEVMHDAGLAHGNLTVECFALLADGSVALCDPGPGMFEGADRDSCVRRDREFLEWLARKAKAADRRPGRGGGGSRGRGKSGRFPRFSAWRGRRAA
jgi:Protein phosphatase 2C